MFLGFLGFIFPLRSKQMLPKKLSPSGSEFFMQQYFEVHTIIMLADCWPFLKLTISTCLYKYANMQTSVILGPMVIILVSLMWVFFPHSSGHRRYEHDHLTTRLSTVQQTWRWQWTHVPVEQGMLGSTALSDNNFCSQLAYELSGVLKGTAYGQKQFSA